MSDVFDELEGTVLAELNGAIHADAADRDHWYISVSGDSFPGGGGLSGAEFIAIEVLRKDGDVTVDDDRLDDLRGQAEVFIDRRYPAENMLVLG